jgi:SagB-type dehydrogenase family enzyme
MKRRELLAGLAASAAVAGGCQAQEKFTQEVALPEAMVTGKVSLEDAITRRRSRRFFKPEPLPLAMIGQLLWSGQGITNPAGWRAAPSAGALYPLELYAVTASELMHYLPRGHRAETRTVADLRPQLRALALEQAPVGNAPVVIVIAAEYARLSQRYGDRAEAYTTIEVGHAGQNILLQAVALGLVAVPIAAVDGTRAARLLALPGGQTVVYLVPVGFMA